MKKIVFALITYLALVTNSFADTDGKIEMSKKTSGETEYLHGCFEINGTHRG